jgi:hypothetical protein
MGHRSVVGGFEHSWRYGSIRERAAQEMSDITGLRGKAAPVLSRLAGD